MASEWTVNRMLCAAAAVVRARELARHPWHARLNALGEGPPAARRRRPGPGTWRLHLAVALPAVPAFRQVLPAAT